MTKNSRWVLLLILATTLFLAGLRLTPSTLSHGGPTAGIPPAGKQAAQRQEDSFTKIRRLLQAGRNDDPIESSELTGADLATMEDEDPDLPPGMTGRVDKEAYLRARGENIDMLRGRLGDDPSEARETAIKQMNKQEALMASRVRLGLASAVNTTDWTFVGPAPIPMGQTQGSRVPVSGRTISIAIHPTDPDTVYVGTAQGGLYKSTNGGTNWTKLFEFDLESLAIGAVTIDPTDSSIVYVGTGENGQSADSAFGRGLYIIRNANSASPTLNGPFRLNGAGNDVFTGRSIGRILVNPLDHNTLFVCTASGTGGNPNTTTVLQAPRGIYRSNNAQSASPTFEQIQITGIVTPNDRSTIDIEMDPNNPNLLLGTVIGVTGDGGIYRTANALDPTPTFTRTLTLPNGATTGRGELTVTRSATPVFYAATGEQSTAALGGPACGATQLGILRRSTDLGLTWSAQAQCRLRRAFAGGSVFTTSLLPLRPTIRPSTWAARLATQPLTAGPT